MKWNHLGNPLSAQPRLRLVLPAAVGLALIAGIQWQAFSAPAAGPDSFFPHALHEGLFPVCSGCHGDVAAGDSLYSVAAADCAHCHNDDLLDAISWEQPGQSVDPSWFDHGLHLGDADLACADCHAPVGSEDTMDIVPAAVDRCADCHDVASHATDEFDCASCHAP